MMGFVRAPLFFIFFSAFLFHGLCVRRTKIDVFRHVGEASGGADEANAPVNAPGPSTPPSVRVQVQVQDKYVVVDNGILQVNLSNPGGSVTGIQYNGINLLEEQNDEFNRGYWDVVWNAQESNKTKGKLDRLDGTKFEVIVQNDEQVELSFARMWNLSLEGEVVPLNIDKRYVILRGSSGFYTYAIYEHLAEWPAFTIDNTRTVIKLRKDKFHYMAIADNRQRYMPLPDDRLPGRGQVLAYPEAVRLINPVEPQFKGEVDDKYEYSCESKDIGVHGWISTDPPIGVWQITPSHEFRNGGPVKQFLTSHVGPTSLNVFASTHYSGINLTMRFGPNEPWKKVYGPVFVYVNSMSDGEDPRSLWMDAKEQLIAEAESWPYKFPASEDYVQPSQRGNVSGRLLVLDRYISEESLVANGAFVGLAPPGDIGSWQRESKGYQFWTRADEGGNFSITGIIPGEYNLYAWVPGFIGDYKYEINITISAASDIDVGELVYEPPRSGPTLWEIGIPDRTASEYYVPDPDPQYINPLYINHPDRYRQYGLWQRYAELYPNEDLIFSVGMSDYRKDWFFAQVTREIGNNTYKGTTWQIKFTIYSIDHTGTYKLQLALATAHESELQVRVNDGNASSPLFSTGVIGKDNTIARHGIHGLYWLFSIDVPGTELIKGENTIFFTQIGSVSPFQGIMYDYIRLETPPPSNSTYRF